MIIRIGLYLVMALGLAGFGAVAWVSTRPPHSVAVALPVPATETVLTAAHPLRAGSLLRPEDLATQTVQKDEVGSDINLDTPSVRGGLIGAMMKRSLAANEVIASAEVMRPGDHGFLAAVLGPGMRAVTVGVDAVSGTAGLIWPGDRVDLILTEQSGNQNQNVSAIRLLSDTRVIAIDQQLVEGVTANSTTNQTVARTVTLEVNGTDSERVEVASRLGSLSLAVRSASQGAPSTELAGASGVVWGTDLLPAQSPPPPRAIPLNVAVWEGAGDAKEFHF